MVSFRRKTNALKYRWMPVLAVLMIMTGCASPARKACLQTDWKLVGYEEGSQGKLAAHSASQRDTCIQEGVSPEMTQYELGRRQGLEKYCTADNGLALGAKGDSYHKVCPQELKAPFMDAYQKGLQTFAQQLEGNINSKEDQQKKMRIQLASVNEDIAYLEKEIAAATEGQARLRMGMISEMDMLEADQQSLTLQISALEMDLEEMRQRVTEIRSHDGARDQ